MSTEKTGYSGVVTLGNGFTFYREECKSGNKQVVLIDSYNGSTINLPETYTDEEIKIYSQGYRYGFKNGEKSGRRQGIKNTRDALLAVLGLNTEHDFFDI